MESSGNGESPTPDDDDEVDCKAAALDIRESMEKSKEFWGDQPPDQSIIPATLLKCPPNSEESKVSYASELAHLAWQSMEQNHFEDIAKINKDLLSNGEIPVNNLIKPINKILQKMGDEYKIKQELQKIDEDYRQAIILVANQLLYIFGENEPPSIAEEEADVGSNVKTKESSVKRSAGTESHRAMKNRIKSLLEAALEQGLGEIKLPKGIYVNDRAKLTLLERQIRGRLRLKNIIENGTHNSPTHTNKSSDTSFHRNLTIGRKHDLNKRLRQVKLVRDKIFTQNVTIGDQKSSENELLKEPSSISTNVASRTNEYAEQLATTSFSESGIKTKSIKNYYDDAVASPTSLDNSSLTEKQPLEGEISREASFMDIQDNLGTPSRVKLHKCSRENLKLRIKNEDTNYESNEIINKNDFVTDNFTESENSNMDYSKIIGYSSIHTFSNVKDLNEPCCSRDEKFDDNLRDESSNMKEQNESDTSLKECDNYNISQSNVSSDFSKCRLEGSSISPVCESEHYETNCSSSSSLTVNSKMFLSSIQNNIIESSVEKANADETLSSSSDLQLSQTVVEKSSKNVLSITERNEGQLSKLNLISYKRSSSEEKIDVKQINVNQETVYTEKPVEIYPFKNEMKIIEKRKDLSLILRDSLSEVHAKTAKLFEQTYNVQPIVKIEPSETVTSLDTHPVCDNNVNISVQSFNETKELTTESSPYSVLSEESNCTKKTIIDCEDKCGDTDIEDSIISENVKKLTENFERVDSEIKKKVSQTNFIGLESDSHNQAFDVGTFSVDELDNSNDMLLNIGCKNILNDKECLKDVKQINEDNDEDYDSELLNEDNKLRSEEENVSEYENDEEGEEDDDDDDIDDNDDDDDDEDESAEVEDDVDEIDEDLEDEEEEEDEEDEESTINEEERSSESSEKSFPEVKIRDVTNEKIINDEIDTAVDSKGKKITRRDNTLLYVTIFLGVFTATYFSDYVRQFFSNVIVSNMKSNTINCLDKAIDVMTALKLKLQER